MAHPPGRDTAPNNFVVSFAHPNQLLFPRNEVDPGKALVSVSEYCSDSSSLGLAIDLSRISSPDNHFDLMGSRMKAAFAVKMNLERGGMANPDENRFVGHYWLRAPGLAPWPEIGREIQQSTSDIKSSGAEVHGGVFRRVGRLFRNLLVTRIGGSAFSSAVRFQSP